MGHSRVDESLCLLRYFGWEELCLASARDIFDVETVWLRDGLWVKWARRLDG